jgi:hypothetical protein
LRPEDIGTHNNNGNDSKNDDSYDLHRNDDDHDIGLIDINDIKNTLLTDEFLGNMNMDSRGVLNEHTMPRKMENTGNKSFIDYNHNDPVRMARQDRAREKFISRGAGDRRAQGGSYVYVYI